MSLAGASTNWLYDGRGHATQATYTVPGLSSTRVFTWTYDSADRVQQIGYPAVGANPRELLTYTYDSAWRPTSACSSFGGCYASSSQPYTALDQPKQWTFGNSLLQTWNYDTLMQRLQQLQVGTSADPGSLFTRSYTYDGVGNVESIADPQLPETQHFSYDQRPTVRRTPIQRRLRPHQPLARRLRPPRRAQTSAACRWRSCPTRG